MNKVFDMSDLPERRLSVYTRIALHGHEDIYEIVRRSKEGMASELATKALKGAPLFESYATEDAGIPEVVCRADCIVMTLEEFAQMKRDAFAEGVKHAQGFNLYNNPELVKTRST